MAQNWQERKDKKKKKQTNRGFLPQLLEVWQQLRSNVIHRPTQTILNMEKPNIINGIQLQ